MHYALKDYGAELLWNVGTLFCHDAVAFKFSGLCRKFSVPNPITWAFGCIHGELSSAMIVPEIGFVSDALKVAARYIEMDIACRLALTNPHVGMKEIQSDTGNAKLMDFLNRNGIEKARNGVILSSDILAEHVRERYPNLEVILSVVRPAYDVGYGHMLDTLEWYVEKLGNPLYDIVEVNNAKIHETGFMEALPDKDRVELIACRNCLRNCPFTKHHFEAALGIARQGCFHSDRQKAKRMLAEVCQMCVAHRERHLDQASSFEEEEIRKLVPLGYRRFQLSNRMNTDEQADRDIGDYLFVYKHLRYFENLL